MEKQRLMNVYVNNLTMMESVNRIHDMIREKQTSYVVEVNVDVVMKMEKDPYLKKISDEADLTLVDGQPLVWISKMKGNTPIREKISGSDLVPELLDELSRENRSVFILGGLGDTAKKAAKKVKKHYPGMSIAGTYAPPLGFEKDAKEIEKINHLVAKTHPDLLLACFGCPKQEKWIYENYKKCGAIVSVCAGATVDFLAGNIKRAPRWISQCGLEWFYRFLKEPRRLFKRYFIDDIGNCKAGMEIPEFINDFRKMRKMGGGKQMKLGILCTMINGFGRRGYYNSQEIGLGRALARKGHEVMIYKGIDPSEKEEKVQVEKNLTIWYLPMKHLGAHGFMDCKYLDPQLKALFCFGDQQIFLPHVYRWCRRRRIPFVAYVGTAHSLDSNFKSKVMNALFAAGTLRIYKKNPVLAKTSAAKEELRQLGVPHAVIAPVGLDNAVLKKNIPADEKMRLRKEHGFEADDVILCNVSRLSWEKRPLELIDLFLQVKGKKKFKLIIVGNGPLEEELNEKIRKNGLEKEVKIYPNVPYEKMWEIYEMSDYYLNMNKGEIFGMAIMEAVYYKTSVAAIRALGPSVTLKDMKGHKLCENDDEMAEWITGPYPSEKDLQESSEKMAATFTWDRCADAFLQASSEKSSR